MVTPYTPGMYDSGAIGQTTSTGTDTDSSSVEGDFYELPDGRWAYDIGESTTVVADSKEDLLIVLEYASVQVAYDKKKPDGPKGKQVGEVSLSDMLEMGIPLSNSIERINGQTKSVLVFDKGLVNDAKNYANEKFMGGDIIEYPPGFDVYFESTHKLDSTDPNVLAREIAGFRGAAMALYQPGGAPIKAGQISPKTQDLLGVMFPDAEYDQGHVNALIATGFLHKNEKGVVVPTPHGTNFMNAQTTVARSQNTPLYPPALGLGAYNQEQLEDAAKAGGFFSGEGYAPNANAGSVSDLAKKLLGGLGGAETPVPSNTVMGEGTESMFQALFGGGPLTAEQLAIARDMGLVTWDAATGKIELTPNGKIYADSVSAATSSDSAASGPVAPAKPTYMTHPDYQAWVRAEALGNDNVKFRPDNTEKSRDSDEYSSPEDLAAKGIPLWMAEWIFRNFANAGVISETTLNALIANGVLTLENKDKGGKKHDAYGLTEKGVRLALADPTSSFINDPETIEGHFHEGMARAWYAEHKSRPDLKDEHGGASNKASFRHYSQIYGDAWENTAKTGPDSAKYTDYYNTWANAPQAFAPGAAEAPAYG